MFDAQIDLVLHRDDGPSGIGPSAHASPGSAIARAAGLYSASGAGPVILVADEKKGVDEKKAVDEKKVDDEKNAAE